MVVPSISTLAVDLLNPSQELEKKQHKLKRLVQSPNSYFMDVKCPGCFAITTVFSHAQTVVICGSCASILCQPTGGRARLTEANIPPQKRLAPRYSLDLVSPNVRRLTAKSLKPQLKDSIAGNIEWLHAHIILSAEQLAFPSRQYQCERRFTWQKNSVVSVIVVNKYAECTKCQ
ncbi:hypothetical protein BDZ89DRAFT_1036016 [Hymenopellis radicata]|nr:hypothetical protein BDZ89DRAFT_1036016 [Hymenopellis radicata]